MVEVSRRQLVQNIFTAILGLLFVLIWRHEYTPESSINLYWLIGGMVLGSVLILFQWFTDVGRELHKKTDNSATSRVTLLVISLAVVFLVVVVGEFHFTPAWLSGMMGLAIGTLLVIPLSLLR